ncbi:MAG TPA: aldo/keto reductase [Bryobacteraceae bacterium]|nr:aldo/keto reductase [Bryobacteraceae bacterium]
MLNGRAINFLDNCWDYHNGKSEVWMGKALRNGYRRKILLMTKFDGRTKQSADKQVDGSLARLQTGIWAWCNTCENARNCRLRRKRPREEDQNQPCWIMQQAGLN